MHSLEAVVGGIKPQFEARTLLEAQRHFDDAGRRARLTPQFPKRFVGYSDGFVKLRQIAISFSTVNAPDGYEISFRPDGEYCLNLPLEEQGWISSGECVEAFCAGQAALIAPGRVVEKHWSGPGRTLTLHMPVVAFEEAIGGPLAALTICDGVGLRALVDFIAVVVRHSQQPRNPLLGDAVSVHLEKALFALVAGLVSAPEPTNASSAKPFYVRRAERFMQANFCSGITLGDMAVAAGVSKRTLQYGFKQFHGSTPMAHFKKLRLIEARNFLARGKTFGSLTALALTLGYINPSHFASDYRAQFGEPPSRTLARRGLSAS